MNYQDLFWKGDLFMNEVFEGRVVIVTGGASGMGRATALKFGALGAKVAVSAGHNLTGAQEVADQINVNGGEAIALLCDVSKESDVEAMVNTVVEKWGRLDYAFNNAGTGPDGVRIGFGPLTELTEEIWDKTMDTNAKGVFLCMKYELRQMLKQGWPCSIVNNASIGGLHMAPGFGAYGPSKAAVIALTQLAARENAPAQIRVNVVCPGPTEGTILMDNSKAASGGKDQSDVIPMGKMGTTDDVSNAVVWLCSPYAGHITGQSISVDGGMNM